ncbi:MAG: MlaD family protein [Treponema sp.]|nr:MlaD family protein [Treponema sp.]
MRLAIRFADKLVGISIVLALGVLVFVLFMLGTNQRWFARDYSFFAYFDSAAGLSPNQAVQYMGFTVGQVRQVELVRLADGDRARVRFVVFDTFADMAREGSLIEVVPSPIGAILGNQFLFHPGLGLDRLPEGAVIHSVGSPEAGRLAEAGLAAPFHQEDGIGAIVERVASLLYVLNEALEGTDRTALGRTLGNVEAATGVLRETIEGLSAGVAESLEALMAQIEPALAGVRAVSEGLADPDGAVMAILDGEGDVYAGLVSSLDAVSGILRNLETATGLVPAQLPQVAALLVDLQVVLRAAEDVLVALANNPLLRRGVPERVEAGPGGTFARDLEF